MEPLEGSAAADRVALVSRLLLRALRSRGGFDDPRCSGVVSILSFERKLAAVPDAEVERLRLLVSTDLRYDPCPFINEGTPVDVIGGPLRGIVGRLVSKDAHHATVMLSVDLIGRGVRVEVSAADIAAR
jgi:transcription antitermination factor NusG